MARRRGGILEDIVEIMAKLPWWVGVIVALLSYFIFNHFASEPVDSSPQNLKNMGEFVKNQMIVTICSIAQYAVPLAALIGSLVSVIKSSKQDTKSNQPSFPRRKSFQQTQTSNNVSCPVCSSAMIKRKKRNGADAGQSFWGCSNYPSCKGTRPV